ncbi:MAG: hypothetical protein FWC39_02055 [Bacteroidetes bacterium]|nr:hypothetical protein [Bacteroidota bacterium]
MEYTIEKIYRLVGKNDYVATVTFRQNCESFEKYGTTLTGVFAYNQCEREQLDTLIENENSFTHGMAKIEGLDLQLTKEKKKQLLEEGINTQDIVRIEFCPQAQNTFHDTEKRVSNKQIIKTRSRLKGGDFAWIFGFYKDLIKNDVGLCPKEYHFYLAMKFLFETESLSEREKQGIFDNNELMNENVEFELLKIKEKCKTLNNDELEKLNDFKIKDWDCRKQKLERELQKIGSSIDKLVRKNLQQAIIMLDSVLLFNERRLNVMGKFPIYIDVDSFLHIYTRHVEDFKVNQQFKDKDCFQWNEDDVSCVIKSVIQEVEGEYQKFRTTNPNTQFSKYGKQSVYYQGDYYTLHIEPNGRISTIHKNRKN